MKRQVAVVIFHCIYFLNNILTLEALRGGGGGGGRGEVKLTRPLIFLLYIFPI